MGIHRKLRTKEKELKVIKNEHGSYKAVAKEIGSSGTPHIALELLDGNDISILENKSIYLALNKETTLEEAEELANKINTHITGLNLTSFN